MGLPLCETARLLAMHGLDIWGAMAMNSESILLAQWQREYSAPTNKSQNITPQETRVAVLEDGIVQELHIERATAGGWWAIYLGKVRRVLPGMQSAFIEIGLERAAFCTLPTFSNSATPRGAGAHREHAV